MDLLEQVYDTLEINKLDESQQEEVKSKINEIVDMKAKEVAKDVSENVTEEVKQELQDEYEKKFEEYKDDITSKFSNFVDEVLDQELQIPEKIYEYARKGEYYEPLIEQFKVKLGIDEGAIQNETKDILREARDEITSLKSEANKEKQKVVELQEDARDFATHIYLREKCDGLPEKQKKKVMNLLEDAKSKEEIDRKFDVLAESVRSKNMLNEDTYYCKECGSEVEVNEDEDVNEKTCPECDGELTKKEPSGKGKKNVEEDKKVNEKKGQSPNPQKKSLKEDWLDIISTGKY